MNEFHKSLNCGIFDREKSSWQNELVELMSMHVIELECGMKQKNCIHCIISLAFDPWHQIHNSYIWIFYAGGMCSKLLHEWVLQIMLISSRLSLLSRMAEKENVFSHWFGEYKLSVHPEIVKFDVVWCLINISWSCIAYVYILWTKNRYRTKF